MAKTFAENGFVFVGVDYRNFPQATIAGMLSDARKAVAWVLEHISEYGGDPTQIILAGQSAGAHIAACLLIVSLILFRVVV
jgi:prenylcysteine alpha-carboxyl methylesterase